MMLRDAVYGAAVGDALGVPYEFMARGSFECAGMVGFGTHRQPAGTWSDDTSLILATCDSFRALGRIDSDDMRARFRAWLDAGEYTADGTVFDVGGTTAGALRLGHGLSGERDNGNGSLMRIAPLAYFGADDDAIADVSSITHAHPTSIGACIEMVGAIRAASNGKAALGDRRRRVIEASGVPSRGYVLHTLDAALWCLATTDSYAECVLKAVNLGGDADTTACVAGALAGEMYGRGSIPAEWLGVLRGVDVIEACIGGIGDMKAS